MKYFFTYLLLLSSFAMADNLHTIGIVTVVLKGTSGVPVSIPSIRIYNDFESCSRIMRDVSLPIYKKEVDNGEYFSVSFTCHIPNEYGQYEMKAGIPTYIYKK